MEKYELLAEFGRKVQFFRKEKGLTQAKLAEMIEKTEDTISNIERGQNRTKIETAGSIAKALDVTLADLFDLPLFDSESKAKSELIRKLIALILQHDIDYAQYVYEQAEVSSKMFKKQKSKSDHT